MVTFPTFATEDEIPEAFRDAYEEVDGEWVAKKPEVDPDADPAKLREAGKKALKAERDARTEAERKAREAEEEAARLRQEVEAKKAGLSEEKLKQLRADVRADIEKEYAGKALDELPEEWKAREQGLSYSSENRSLKLDNQVKALAGENGVRGERLDKWWKLHADKFDLTEDGKPMVKDHPGTEVKDFIAGELKEDTPEFYTGTQAAGGGAGGIQRDGKLVAGTSAEDVIKNPGESLRAAREAGAGS